MGDAATADTASGARILVVDDERNIRATLSLCLEAMGCRVTAVASAEAAREASHRQSFDAALVDLRLGATSGLDLISELRAERGDLPIVLISAYATIEAAVAAMRRGAVDVLPKPFTPEEVRARIAPLLGRRRLERRVAELEAELREAVPEAVIETGSPRLRAVLDVLARAAAADVPVLLRGENGTGKGVLARFLHAQSPRHAGPFVVVNCPTLSDELLASELFGHARGAFTGAVKDQPGRVEAAEGGTLFLDEIGEISTGLQAKLLRFLQDRQFERIGESRTRRADVRLVAATNRDLESDIATGRFREDLFYRLNVIELVVPPLRERTEDIVPLARRFIEFFARGVGRRAPALTPEAERVLLAYGWPGNVRELRNTIERALILGDAPHIEPRDLTPRLIATTGEATPGDLRVGDDVTLDDLEREHIRRVVARQSTLEEAARVLGIEPSTLWRKRKKFGD